MDRCDVPTPPMQFWLIGHVFLAYASLYLFLNGDALWGVYTLGMSLMALLWYVVRRIRELEERDTE